MDAIIKMVEQMEVFAFIKTHDGRQIFEFMLMHADIEFDFVQEKRKSNDKKAGKEERLKLLVNTGSWYISSTNICAEYNENDDLDIESQVSQIVYDMFVNAVKINCKIEISKRNQERKWEEEKRQRELKEFRKAEMGKIAKLDEFISDWEHAEKIRNFVAKIEAKIEKESNEDLKLELVKIVIWSKEKAEWLDPLNNIQSKLTGLLND